MNVQRFARHCCGGSQNLSRIRHNHPINCIQRAAVTSSALAAMPTDAVAHCLIDAGQTVTTSDDHGDLAGTMPSQHA